MNNNRVIVFVDGSNLFWGLKYFNEKNGTSTRIDYSKLADELTRGRTRIRSYYYGSESVPPKANQRSFHDALRYSGYQVIVKPLKIRKDIETGKEYAIEKGVDVSLVSDLLCLAWEGAYDVAVLVTGDADFLNPIEKVKYKGKIVEIASFKNSLSGELRKIADKTVFLDDLIDKIKRE